MVEQIWVFVQARYHLLAETLHRMMAESETMYWPAVNSCYSRPCYSRPGYSMPGYSRPGYSRPVKAAIVKHLGGEIPGFLLTI